MIRNTEKFRDFIVGTGMLVFICVLVFARGL